MNAGFLSAIANVAEWRPRKWWFVAAVAAICVALAVGGDELRHWGRYDREALANGEVWRLVTAHLLHLGWGHLWPNLVALLLIGILFERAFDTADWLLVAAASITTIDVGLYLLDPAVEWYVGLSGLLHGLVAGGALSLLCRGDGFGAVLAAGLAAKLTWEQLFGPLPFTATATGGPVIIAAHLYGAAGGFAVETLRCIARRRRGL